MYSWYYVMYGQLSSLTGTVFFSKEFDSCPMLTKSEAKGA